MSDVEFFEGGLAEEISTIRIKLQSYPSLDDSRKPSAINEIEEKVRKANGTKRAFKMECRMVADANLKKKYELTLQQRTEELSQLENDVETLKKELMQSELFVDAEDSEAAGVELGNKMIGEMHAIQDKTQEGIDNIKNLVEESRDVGSATLEKLRQQNEQILEIDKDVDKLEYHLKYADKMLKKFSKELAKDTFIQMMTLINISLLVSVIYYAYSKMKGVDEHGSELPSVATDRMMKVFLRASNSDN